MAYICRFVGECARSGGRQSRDLRAGVRGQVRQGESYIHKYIIISDLLHDSPVNIIIDLNYIELLDGRRETSSFRYVADCVASVADDVRGLVNGNRFSVNCGIRTWKSCSPTFQPRFGRLKSLLFAGERTVCDRGGPDGTPLRKFVEFTRALSLIHV